MYRLAFALVIVCTSAQGFQLDTRPPDSDREKGVYAIYSLMLTNPSTSHGRYTSDRYLIARTTGPGYPQEPCVRPPKGREPDFREVLTDYESRKAIPRELTHTISIDKPYVLLSTDEVGQFQQERSTGPVPDPDDSRFRGISDLFTLSNVYFNKAGTLALTGMFTFCGSLCGSYRWMIFEKVGDGNWEERRWTTCFTMAGNLGSPAQNAPVSLATTRERLSTPH
jgi:hypothetical protein